ncbi:uncharacterized protein MELLADRAFT_108387 [Melampsora larici-populina 98AG31]|uniref:Uncharacterized protein n=1 Tax=Melampsora larici-populina (strain 98AG31 / pathotype 3-4-7) TaxID=747676 RepID=F4RSY2_MELLP|nr:uncharacterized protein MELLADRAFT_108387 [Melampsora larici-populina 98AG31]EGG04408.1 hypothetical protein MELLADRAFT_108387 [Melampsora larici-populina 98AG31]
MLHAAIITATLPVTTHSMQLSRGFFQWHQSTASLLLNDSDGSILVHPVTALGFVTQTEVLKCSHAYTISGPLSYEVDTGTTIIQHNAGTHVDVGEFKATYRRLVGRATLSGLGRIAAVNFIETTDDVFQWNLEIVATHDYYHPIHQLKFSQTRRSFSFQVTYHFFRHTPPPRKWGKLTVGKTVWLHGNIMSKHTASGNFVVHAADVTVIRSLITAFQRSNCSTPAANTPGCANNHRVPPPL